jgi:hypothetical protein
MNYPGGNTFGAFILGSLLSLALATTAAAQD